MCLLWWFKLLSTQWETSLRGRDWQVHGPRCVGSSFSVHFPWLAVLLFNPSSLVAACEEEPRWAFVCPAFCFARKFALFWAGSKVVSRQLCDLLPIRGDLLISFIFFIGIYMLNFWIFCIFFCRLPVLKEIPILSLLTRCLSSKKSSVRQRFLEPIHLENSSLILFHSRVSRWFFTGGGLCTLYAVCWFASDDDQQISGRGGGRDTIATWAALNSRQFNRQLLFFLTNRFFIKFFFSSCSTSGNVGSIFSLNYSVAAFAMVNGGRRYINVKQLIRYILIIFIGNVFYFKKMLLQLW